MLKKRITGLTAFMALVYAIVFHNSPLGLNLLIFDVLCLAALVAIKPGAFRNGMVLFMAACFLITAVATVLAYSFWAYLIHFIIFIFFIGTLNFPEIRSLFHAFPLFAVSAFNAPLAFFRHLGETSFRGKKMGIYLKRTRIFLIPLFIIIIFVVIYRNSNPVFDEALNRMGERINDAFVFLFGRFDATVVLTYLLGLLFCMFILLHTPFRMYIEGIMHKSDRLERLHSRVKRRFSLTALKNEYKAGIFLFAVLNLILLVVNSIDVYWVWFNFEWNGQYLKQFVHEGTYLLILSIIISVVLVLFYFRKNLNFYSNNTILRRLSYVWLVQNALLAISVGIRNFWYVYYYALAYKRIAVFVFLILTLYGLYTVFMKVHHRKSAFYMIRLNALALFAALTITTVFNWDCIIARFNFSRAGKAFVHFNFLSNLSGKALPYLDKPYDMLKSLEDKQSELFPSGFRYMTAEEYKEKIENKKARFKEKWEHKGILSWNYPEYRAYRILYGTP